LEDELIVRYGIERLIPPRLWPENRDTPLNDPVVRREIARAQRIIEGQSFDIRRTLYLYSEQVETQRRIVHRRRREILLGRTSRSLLAAADPARHADLCSRFGERAVRRAEEQVTLYHLDRRWSEHLGVIADLREGIHLVRIGGRDPLTEFLPLVVHAFQEMQSRIRTDVVRTLREATLTAEGIDLRRAGLEHPSATWTYVVNDDPFRDQLGVQLGSSHAVGAVAALYTGPLIVLWGLYNRYLRRRRVRSADHD
jgi:preprotein translocase subunit SecA